VTGFPERGVRRTGGVVPISAVQYQDSMYGVQELETDWVVG